MNQKLFFAELRDIMQYMIKDNNPDVLWEDFKTKFLLVADVHATQITRKVKSEYTPWMTNNIKKQIYHRDSPKKKAIKTGSENMFVALSPPQRLLFFKKPRKRGKGGKTGKAEKAREKGKSEESLCQISVEI